MKAYFKSEANDRLREKCTQSAFLSGLKRMQSFSSFQFKEMEEQFKSSPSPQIPNITKCEGIASSMHHEGM